MRTILTLFLRSILVAFAIEGAASAQVNEFDAQTRFAESVVVDALDFRQGDLPSLVDAEHLFTPPGWADFVKRLAGYVDAQGAATFTSTFTPTGPAVATKQNKESLIVTVPGVLKHERRSAPGEASTASYRAEIDITVSPRPFKIDLLIQRTCGGARTRPSCR